MYDSKWCDPMTQIRKSAPIEIPNRSSRTNRRRDKPGTRRRVVAPPRPSSARVGTSSITRLRRHHEERRGIRRRLLDEARLLKQREELRPRLHVTRRDCTERLRHLLQVEHLTDDRKLLGRDAADLRRHVVHGTRILLVLVPRVLRRRDQVADEARRAL